jgi:hypothetical protein
VNDIDLLQASGPDAPPLRPAAVHAARAALLAEIGTARTPRRRFRRPTRRTSLRIGLAAATAAAAWTAAVVVAGPDTPPDGVTLVGFAMPTLPLALPAPPPGLTGPEYDGSGDAVGTYYSAEGSRDLVGFAAGREETDACDDFDTHDVRVGGRSGEFGLQQLEGYDSSSACLQWERRPGQWVRVYGDGRYADEDQLVAVAEQLVDDEQVVPLQVHLAPAGWQLQGFKLSGRVLTLASEAHPDQSLSVHLPEQAYPADELPGRLEQVAGPLREVTVHGLPAQLVPTGYGWYLQASFPDGTAFAVQAPPSFTADDVVAVADQVTYSPPAG